MATPATATTLKPIRIYTTPSCGYCVRAKTLLKQRGYPFQEVDVAGDATKRAWLVEVTGRRTVPQIFFGDESIGGFDDLNALDRAGTLADRLRADAR